MSELAELYLELEGLLEEFRVEWERTRRQAGRKENYWQGKKDGLRTALNLLYPFVRDELTQEE